MYHQFDTVTNTRGDSLVGYQVVLRAQGSGAIVPIFADENGTPIISVSGLSNIALTDNAGNYNLFVDYGTYDLEFRTPDGVSIQLIRAVPMVLGEPGAPGDVGPTGPANSTYTTLAALKAAPATNKSYILADPSAKTPVVYAYVVGNFTGQADDINVVKLDAVPLTTGALVAGGTVSGTRPVTDKFVGNLQGAIINAIGDRILGGGAAGYDGNYPNDDPAHQDWYTAYERSQGRGNGIIVSSQAAILTNNNNGSAAALTVAARTSNFHPAVGGAVGLEAHVVNDNTVSAHDAWAIYSEATRDSDDVGSIITYEADSRNKGAYHAIHPYAQSGKQSVVHQIASGGALTGVGCEDVSAGINFRHNPTKFGAGIVFGNSSIRDTDGNGIGVGNAILFARGHQMAWCNAAGEQTSFIYGAGATTTSKMSISFLDLGMTIGGPSDTTVAIFRPVGASVNYLDFSGALINEQPVIAVNGFNANIDLKLTTKGEGTVAIGNAANFVANGSGTPVFTSTLPAGITPTVKEWWAIHNANGQFRLIPLFGV